MHLGNRRWAKTKGMDKGDAYLEVVQQYAGRFVQGRYIYDAEIKNRTADKEKYQVRQKVGGSTAVHTWTSKSCYLYADETGRRAGTASIRNTTVGSGDDPQT